MESIRGGQQSFDNSLHRGVRSRYLREPPYVKRDIRPCTRGCTSAGNFPPKTFRNSVVFEGPLPIGYFFCPNSPPIFVHLPVQPRATQVREEKHVKTLTAMRTRHVPRLRHQEDETLSSFISPATLRAHQIHITTCQDAPREKQLAPRYRLYATQAIQQGIFQVSVRHTERLCTLLTDWNRPFQREIILAALAGNDVFVQAATSFGKSLCFQLPAVIDHGSKYLRVSESSRLRVALSDAARFPVTIVISPLLSLMVSPASGHSVCNKYLG